MTFSEHPYAYEHKGGTKVSARELGVEEHSVIKTLIMEDDARKPLIILMHGDLSVSTKELARHLGVKRVTPCSPVIAERLTGYQVGGTSPFGTKRELPLYIESSILDLDALYINGGKRGFLISMTPEALIDQLPAKLVNVAQARR